jgi:ABC-type protease/lipase transport system fused ATPase/permease subunit
MRVKEPDLAAVMPLVWRQAPAPLVFSFLATLLLVGAVLQVYDDVLPSGAHDTLLWVTTATLVAIPRYHFSPQAGSKRSGFSISPR